VHRHLLRSPLHRRPHPQHLEQRIVDPAIIGVVEFDGAQLGENIPQESFQPSELPTVCHNPNSTRTHVR
jgi:hypothetical protein